METPQTGFHQRSDGWYCDKIPIADLRDDLAARFDRPTPVMVYSYRQLEKNLKAYKEISLLNIEIGYSMKANNCLRLLKIISEHTDRVITVSGYEIRMALRAGFNNEKIIFNGNGKERWEIELAISQNCILNVDSEFDASHIVAAAEKLEKVAKVFIRVNPDLDPQVHPYISTGLADSKFGVGLSQLDKVTEKLKSPAIQLIGLHCHLGSTIKNVKVYEDVAQVLHTLGKKLRASGFPQLQYLNIGGGLGIDYTGDDILPSPSDIFRAVERQISSEFKVILEPGRSIVGNTGALLVDVIGIKQNGSKTFAVVNGAMNDVIRPSLYSAHHRIELVSRTDAHQKVTYDIVGPICESADFLGKGRLLPALTDGSTLAVLDCGAYCTAMASNYNIRGRVMEILVTDDSWSVIRRREEFEDLLVCMTE